jgi:hypothetical protein
LVAREQVVTSTFKAETDRQGCRVLLHLQGWAARPSGAAVLAAFQLPVQAALVVRQAQAAAAVLMQLNPAALELLALSSFWNSGSDHG